MTGFLLTAKQKLMLCINKRLYWYGGGIDCLERLLQKCPETNFLGHAPGFWCHISDDQLAAMHRRHTKAQAYELIDKLRQAIPDLALRTTLLVGYPGETEADFEELLEFVRTVRFERLGVFPYSEEEGTYSARNLPDDVPEEVKQSRVERVMALQNEISLENNRARIGQLERVIIDSRQGDFYVGRSQYDSPEVDQEILIPAAGRRLIRGCFYQVRITAAEDYDLYGELETK